MNKVSKKVTNFIIILTLIFSQLVLVLSDVYAQSESIIQLEKKDYINLQEAEKIATDFLYINSNSDKSEGWDDFTYIGGNIICQDTKYNISAYVFELYNKISNDSSGYIVVGASSIYCPIIEFGFEHEFPYKRFLNKTDTLIYEGGNDFFIYDRENESYYTCDYSRTVVNKEDINCIYSINNDIQEQWDDIESLDETQIGNNEKEILNTYGSSSVYSDYLSINIVDKIEGCSGTNVYMINKIPTTSKTMSTFYNLSGVSKQCCSPTAALNLLYCYYNYNKTSYSSLIMSAANEKTAINNTFLKLYSLMKTNSSGTYLDNMVSGLNKYLKNYTKYKSSTVTYIGMINFNAETFLNELKANRPVLINTHNHSCYGDHTMVCVGLRSYTNGSLYYVVLDGHNAYKRYMNYLEGNAYYTEAVSVHLYK